MSAQVSRHYSYGMDVIKMEEKQLTAVFIGHNECYGLDDSKLREASIKANYKREYNV